MPTVPARFILSVVFVLLSIGLPSRGDESRGTAAGDVARVTVPLADYLQLRERVEAGDRERKKPPEPAVAELVSQDTSLVVDEETAQVEARFEVEIRGDQREPLALPLTGIATRATIDPGDGASLHRSKTGQLVLVPHRPGTYRIEVRGVAPLEETVTGSRLTLAATDAPVATTRLELPVELDWKSSGAVVVEDEVSGGRRRLQLALPRGREQTVDLGRDLDQETVQEALVQAVLVTVLDLDSLGSRRHDIVLYEVLRGELSSFELTLPPGLTVEQVGSDEGDVIPVRDDDWLTVSRDRRLTGTGYVVLTSPASSSGTLSLEPVEPSVPVRAHYLVLASTVVTEILPRPEKAWSRVDLDDLPTLAREALRTLRPTAAWRRTADAGPEERLSVTLDPLPPVPASRTLVARRETTTLLTREGSLVHQERFTVRRVASAFELDVPTGMKLWSASVDGREVRPVVRGESLAIPLTLQGEEEAHVEVVVLEKEPLPQKRSQLTLILPRVELPVLDHRWRLLLPETHRYRYEEGTLISTDLDAVEDRGRRTVPTATFIGSLPGRQTARLTGQVNSSDGSALPGATVTITAPGYLYEGAVVTDTYGTFHFPRLPAGRYELTAQLDGFQTNYQEVMLRDGESREVSFVLELGEVQEELLVLGTSRRGHRPSKRELEGWTKQELSDSRLRKKLTRLNQGLVGGVRPLPVEIPETGKLLLLSGALPPPQVTARVSVKRAK